MPSAGVYPRNLLVDTPCTSSGNAEVQQAFDPGRNYLYEAWIGCSGIGFARSLDGGYSFQPAMPVPGSLGALSWDPSVVLAPNGTVYVGYMRDLRNTGDAPQIAWSWNFGASFAGNTTAFHPNPAAFADRDFLAVAPNGTVYLSWDYSPPGSPDRTNCVPGASCYFVAGAYNILVIRSSDGGVNWSNPVPVDPEYPSGGATAGPLLVEPSGTVALLYQDAPTNVSHYLLPGGNYFTRSFDGGRSWSAPVPVGNGSESPTDWWINGALSRGSDGTLYAAFDNQSAGTDTAWLALSKDDGVTWGNPMRVNPDVDAAAHLMVTPAAGGAGAAFVAWMTNNSTGAGWTTWLSELAPNGTALEQPIRLSSRIGAAGFWVGDTLGLTYLGLGAVAVSWSYGAPLPNGTLASEVFAAVVGDPPPSAPSINAATPGPASVNLSWSPGAAAGPVSGYNVSWNATGVPPSFHLVGPTPTNLIVTDLAPSVTYSLHVAAFNPSGVGPVSIPVQRRLSAWGAVNGTVQPGSASVALDGQPVLVAGGAFAINTTPGLHFVAASATGYAGSNASVELAWNTTVPLAFDLLALNGTVRGRLDPASAFLFWDGATAGVSLNGSFRLLGAGFSNHSLRVDAPNYLPFQTTVFVPGNQTVWLNVTLVPTDGSLQLAVSPIGATVTVNRSSVALGPDGRANVTVRPGRYAVEVSAPGYISQNFSVGVGPGQSVPLVVTLLPAPTLPERNTSTLPSWALDAGLAAFAIVVVAAAVYAARRDRGRPPTASRPQFEQVPESDVEVLPSTRPLGGDDLPP
ncbi:MAG: fibronectin type III domain-containing protein [Thermoplasmata archaeon]|nr:fibronectin type III domain-containing protein [Thermoplasmata archaeon]